MTPRRWFALCALLVCGAALAQQLPSLPFSPSSGGGASTSSLSGSFLKLDSSNGPLTGSLEIATAANTYLWVHDAAPSSGTVAFLFNSGDTGTAQIALGTISGGNYWDLTTVAAAGVSGPLYIEDCHAVGGSPTGCVAPLTFVAGSAGSPGMVQLGKNGTAASPALGWSTVVDSGLYTSGNNSIGLAAGGVQSLMLTTTQARAGFLGTTSVPAYSFEADSDSGVWSPGANTLAVSVGGVERQRWGASEIVANETGAAINFRVEGDTLTHALFVDGATDRVGIGVSSPTAALDVDGNVVLSNQISGNSYISIANLDTSATSQNSLYLGNGSVGQYSELVYANSGFTTAGLRTARQTTLLSSGAGGMVIGSFSSGAEPAGDVIFTRGGFAALDERLRLSSGEVVVNDAATAVDFRVEGDSLTHLLYVDSGANAVSINDSTPTSGPELTVGGEIDVGSGSVTNASLSFGNDIDTGLYSSAAETVSVVTGGFKRLDVDSVGVSATVPFLAPGGSTTNVAFGFIGDEDTGMYRPITNQLALVTAGTARLTLTSTTITAALPVLATLGSESAPAYSFSSDSDSGVWSTTGKMWMGANGGTGSEAQFWCDGTLGMCASEQRLASTLDIVVGSDGSASAPGIVWANDPDTGIYHQDEVGIAFAINGEAVVSIDNGAGIVSQGLYMTHKSSGNVDVIRIPGAVGTTTAAFPSCAAASLGTMFYINDTDHGVKKGGICFCNLATDNTTYNWVGIGEAGIEVGTSTTCLGHS